MTPTFSPSFYASSAPMISPIYCCSWNGNECGSTDETYCNESQNNCVDDCGGNWIEYSSSTIVPSVIATTFSPFDSPTMTPTNSPTVSPTMTPTGLPTVS